MIVIERQFGRGLLNNSWYNRLVMIAKLEGFGYYDGLWQRKRKKMTIIT